MGNFANNPNLKNASGEQTIRRWVHTPLTFDHNGIQVEIKEHGKVLLSKVAKISGEDVELVSIEVPASLIFKTQEALNLTRKAVYLPVSSQPSNKTE